MAHDGVGAGGDDGLTTFLLCSRTVTAAKLFALSTPTQP
jgi:hypothetical protein